MVPEIRRARSGAGADARPHRHYADGTQSTLGRSGSQVLFGSPPAPQEAMRSRERARVDAASIAVNQGLASIGKGWQEAERAGERSFHSKSGGAAVEVYNGRHGAYVIGS